VTLNHQLGRPSRSLAYTTQTRGISHLDRYDQVWDVHVLPRLGDYALRELTTGLIEDELLAPMEAARVGRATQLKALYIVQAVLRYAVRRQLIPYNPAEQVERPRKRKRAVRPIAPVAVERMLSLLGPRDAMLVELLGYQGLRPGEALALTDNEVRERTLLVEAAIAVGEEKDTKTQRSAPSSCWGRLCHGWRSTSSRPARSASSSVPSCCSHARTASRGGRPTTATGAAASSGRRRWRRASRRSPSSGSRAAPGGGATRARGHTTCGTCS
jgi:integrase